MQTATTEDRVTALELQERLTALLLSVKRACEGGPWEEWAVLWLVKIEEATTPDALSTTLANWAQEGLDPGSFDGIPDGLERECRVLVAGVAELMAGWGAR